jgi:5-methylcytosine-specific restriction endonuclease McrA
MKQAGYKTRPQYQFCLVCGKTFKPSKRSNGYCSRECFEQAHKINMSGSNNPSYIDGRSADTTYNAGSNWKTIRLSVYERDNYTCQSCGVKCVSKATAMEHPEYSSRIIQCHHIDPYKQSQDNSMDNLITLCIVCHRAVHNGK